MLRSRYMPSAPIRAAIDRRSSPRRTMRARWLTRRCVSSRTESRPWRRSGRPGHSCVLVARTGAGPGGDWPLRDRVRQQRSRLRAPPRIRCAALAFASIGRSARREPVRARSRWSASSAAAGRPRLAGSSRAGRSSSPTRDSEGIGETYEGDHGARDLGTLDTLHHAIAEAGILGKRRLRPVPAPSVSRHVCREAHQNALGGPSRHLLHRWCPRVDGRGWAKSV
jgi:hypothetical protein